MHVLESKKLLVECLCPSLAVAARHSVLVDLRRAVRVNCWVKTLESTVVDACKVTLMLISCYLEKLQHVKVKLLLGNAGKCISLDTSFCSQDILVQDVCFKAP